MRYLLHALLIVTIWVTGGCHLRSSAKVMQHRYFYCFTFEKPKTLFVKKEFESVVEQVDRFWFDDRQYVLDVKTALHGKEFFGKAGVDGTYKDLFEKRELNLDDLQNIRGQDRVLFVLGEPMITHGPIDGDVNLWIWRISDSSGKTMIFSEITAGINPKTGDVVFLILRQGHEG